MINRGGLLVDIYNERGGLIYWLPTKREFRI